MFEPLQISFYMYTLHICYFQQHFVRFRIMLGASPYDFYEWILYRQQFEYRYVIFTHLIQWSYKKETKLTYKSIILIIREKNSKQRTMTHRKYKITHKHGLKRIYLRRISWEEKYELEIEIALHYYILLLLNKR